MNANDLKKKVEIWRYNRSVNAGGTPIEQFEFFKHCYAGMRTLSGALTNDPAPGTVSEVSVEFVIRYDKDIDYNCEIRYKVSRYKIKYIDEIIENGWMKIRTTVYNEYEV